MASRQTTILSTLVTSFNNHPSYPTISYLDPLYLIVQKSDFSTEQSFAGKFEDLTHSVGGDIFVLDDKTIYIQVAWLNS